MMRRIVCIVFVGLGLTCSGGVAVAAPSANIDRVQLAPRAELSEDAWSPTTDTYRSAYVKPSGGWSVRLNGCSSRSDSVVPTSPVPALSWLLEPLDGQPGVVPIRVEAAPTECNKRARLRAMGHWRITLTTRDAAGVTATARREMVFRDVLVAAIGDSFTSGEGQSSHELGVSRWLDRQCHRGRNPWPMRVARSLENDSTTVTFVNFACSGADLGHLTDTQYKGADPAQADKNLRPQILKLRTLLGDPLLPEPKTRTVDLLLGSIGINALNVGSTLKDCALDLFSGTHLAWLGLFLSDCRRDFGAAFRRLPDAYDQLELAISANLRVAQFHIIGYPSRVFTDARDKYPKKFTGLRCLGLCKVRAFACFPFQNLRVADKQFVTRSVDTVNGLLRGAAKRSGWWSLTPTKDLFRHHGYCAIGYNRPWLRRFEGSLDSQHDELGTAHPLSHGHKATAKAVRRSVRLNVRAPAPDTFIVRILSLRLTLAHQGLPVLERPRVFKAVEAAVPGAARAECLLRAAAGASVPPGQCQIFAIQTAGRTVAVRASATIQRFVPLRPKNPAEPDAGHGEQQQLVAQRFHRRADNWDVGRRWRFVDASGWFGTLKFEYRVTKQDGPVVNPQLAAADRGWTGGGLLLPTFLSG
jgi:hypothetical protein